LQAKERAVDPILYWNAVTLEANRLSHTNGQEEQTGPILSSRALAIVHLAMYDAFVGTDSDARTLPYMHAPAIPAPPSNASVDAAVAAAAHATLSQLFPSQRAVFDHKHLEAGLTGGGLQDGHQYGLAVAQRILAAPKNDPPVGDNGYAASMARGAHRPDPDNPGQGFHGPFYGAGSTLFATKQRYKLNAPPTPLATNGTYMQAFRQVRYKGIAPKLSATVPSNRRRTVDETVIGVFWGYDGALEIGTPPPLYNQIVRLVAEAQGNTTAQNAELFALVNAAMGDAGILAWEEKYRHYYWRPVVGIREHDQSMGPSATGANNVDNDCDASWLPLGAPKSNAKLMEKNFTPPFPSYPSGHATLGAAALHIARLFYKVTPGDRKRDDLLKDDAGNDLGIVSDEFNGVTRDNKGTVRPKHVRSFPDGLWQMIIENGRSRVFLGVHWVFDAFAVTNNGEDPDLAQNLGGVRLGVDIAEDIMANGLDADNNGAAPTTQVLPFALATKSTRKPWPLG
jgi:vanadium chloroperoxidase